MEGFLMIVRIAFLAACWLALVVEGQAQSLTILHNFGDGSVANDGSAPGQIVLSYNGYYYGISSGGGSSGKGCVFAMASSGSVTILHSFGDGSVANDGANPEGIILGADGNFYGTTSAGGSKGDGTVFKMSPTGTVSILHSFGDGSVTNDGILPMAGVIQGSDGNLYGTTNEGGANGEGTVFKSTPQGTITILHNFPDKSVAHDGVLPFAPLIQASDGNFYGTTYNGGTGGTGDNGGTGAIYSGTYYSGTVFRITPSGTLTIIHNFNDGSVFQDGFNTTTGLVQGADGNFYGTTNSGGTPEISNGQYTTYGTVYKMTPSGSVTILHNFNDGSLANDGVTPSSGLLLGFDGNLYGTTSSSVASGNTTYGGTVFRITPQGILTNLHNFGDGTVTTDGSGPKANLAQGPDGALYGSTIEGGTAGNGTLLKLNLNTPALTSVITGPGVNGSVGLAFSYLVTGSNTPVAFAASNLPPGLSITSNTGLISGTPTKAGTYVVNLALTNSAGTSTFPLALVISAEPVPQIISSSSSYGEAGLAFDYSIIATNTDGTTMYLASGLTGSGLSLNAATGTITGTPTAGTYTVTLTAKNAGGSSAPFTLTLQITPTSQNLSQEYSILHQFGDGSVSGGGTSPEMIIQGVDGNLYGASFSGGANGYGSIFKITLSGVESVVYSFTTNNPQYLPTSLMQGADGNLYSTSDTQICRITPAGQFTILHHFVSPYLPDVVFGTSPLIQGTDGNFYGTTLYGEPSGALESYFGGGTFFKMSPQGIVTVLHYFNDGTVTNDGQFPLGGLTQGPDGNFYGTTAGGGSDDAGTVFKITPQGTETILHQFRDGTTAYDGYFPLGGVIFTPDGSLYGTTQLGGSSIQFSSGWGTIFKISSQGTYSIVHAFNSGSVPSDGRNPQSKLMQGFDGFLYGTTSEGGSYGTGTVFQFVPSSMAVTIENSFGSVSNDGSLPYMSAGGFTTQNFTPDPPLIESTAGNFYGTTPAGGINNSGTLYTFQANQTPTTTPTIIGSTTIEAAINNPLFYVIQALESQATSDSGLIGEIAQSNQQTSTSLLSNSLAFITPAGSTPPAPTSWVLNGTLPPNITFDDTTGTATGELVATPGMYTFSIAPQNNAGAGTQRTVTMYVEQPPTITSSAAATPTQGVPYSYQVVVSDYDFPFLYSATQLPGWLSVNTAAGTITGTPPGPGKYVFNPIATNVAGSTGLQVTLTVAATSQNAPVITSAATLTGTAGTPVTYPIMASNSPTSFSALTLPPGLLFNSSSGLIYGTPTTAGTYNVPITATNSSTTYAAVVTMNIAPAVPTLASTLSAMASQGSSFSYQIPANGVVTSYGVTGNVPSWLQLNTTTGLLSGTPTSSGNFTITVSASNGTGTTSASLTITVAASTRSLATDTPTMPPWALVVLAMLLVATGSKIVPKVSSYRLT